MSPNLSTVIFVFDLSELASLNVDSSPPHRMIWSLPPMTFLIFLKVQESMELPYTWSIESFIA